MRTFWLGLACIGLATLTSCQGNTYAKQLTEEKKLISNFIEREGLNILREEPDSNYVWGEKDYYQVVGYDNLYFHLIKRGANCYIEDNDTTWFQPAIATETIVMRYKRFTLSVPSDTASYWSTLDTPYPVEFKYLTDYINAPVGWHAAVTLMKYGDSECQIICPSKLGFTEDGNTVTPYGYILKMKIKR